MNVYDFDKTIFYPDSSYTFVLWCLRKAPGKCLKILPELTVAGIKKALGKISTKTLKETAFSFLSAVDYRLLVPCFWEENYKRIGEWYLKQKRPDDVIVSASPEFLLQPISKKLGVTIIGTRMDPVTGKISGKNCHDEEKVPRLFERFPNAHIENFYSDSDSDLPLAKLADHAWKLNHYYITAWNVTEGQKK